jgi:hypothetical protein
MDEAQANSQAALENADAIPETSPTRVAAKSSAEQAAIDLPIEACAHCWMHSQRSSVIASVIAPDPLKRSVEPNAPPADFVPASPSPFNVPIMLLEHGPPGNGFPRHILINVFRI